MAGAIAGTAILYAPKEKTNSLHTVTLTINNVCDGTCPHCYLQYDGREGTISKEHAEKILEADFKHLAIVGKEPCLNSELVRYFAMENSRKGRKTSIVTNGMNLHSLSKDTLERLDYIDVSFDGGPNTYAGRRGRDFKEVITNLEQAFKGTNLTNFNALHTLYSENLGNLDDMVKLQELFPFGNIAFSLYKVPYNHGSVHVTRASLLEEVVPALAKSSSFRNSPKTRLLISSLDLTTGNPRKFFDEIEWHGLTNKLHYVRNPLHHGFIRVTYDGKVLTPNDAIHPILYNVKGYSLKDHGFNSLNEIFAKLQKEETT